MFLENTINHAKQSGWMEVICGSMFSGKTEELIRRLRRAEMAGQQVEIFKPRIDVRYSEEDIVSHNENKIRSTAVDNPDEILLLGSNCDVVGIDEAQFLTKVLLKLLISWPITEQELLLRGWIWTLWDALLAQCPFLWQQLNT